MEFTMHIPGELSMIKYKRYFRFGFWRTVWMYGWKNANYFEEIADNFDDLINKCMEDYND